MKLPLLDEGSELVDAARVLTDHLLGSGSTDDDLSLEGGLAHTDARVTDFSQFTVKELGG